MPHVVIAIIGSRRGAVIAKQVAGFVRFAPQLRSGLGVTSAIVELTSADRIAQTAVAHMPDVLVVVPSWKEPVEALRSALLRVAEREVRPALVLMDTYDPTSSPHFGVLDVVDRYLKRSVLRDMGAYARDYEGGQVLSDFAARTMGFALKGWYFGSPLPPEHAHKLRGCWSFGISPAFERLLVRARTYAPLWTKRPFDLNRRIGLAPLEVSTDTWYRASRLAAARALEPLRDRYRCTGAHRVGRWRYFFELLLSKVVFSPFGWGEVCFRDYEAVCAGCLLVKPSMEHMRTSPDVFVPGETYLPVRWDLSDLEDVIAGALRDPARSAQIAARAQATMAAYFAQGAGFVRDVQESLGGLGGILPSRDQGAAA